ncbi:unnamed protein product (macronuclear) [Paramecium tetraurelia]|uniref:PX domain-containing protein n=1 Tax=Paramecium tetraurelia TaxID=5888 RepID=A0CQB1_PARTE|nr:uncharacterized protein GSPATT00009326001 [Paramecium tetraurelia]CAK72978.1 unnamed protein product [Paramecium tetraurelia]|eukprot:XP_001440375.1 hypothetical protein (macronuclear) [Paramecium tetraurelia strain d4-2]
MDQQNNCDEVQQKEKLLKAEILDKGYDSEAFISYMEQQKENGGQDIDMWTYQELSLAIAQFQQINQPQQDQQMQNVGFGKSSDVDEKNLQNVEQNEQNLNSTSQSLMKEQSQSQLQNELIKEISDVKSNFSKIHLCKTQDKKDLFLQSGINVQITKYQRIPGGIFTSSYYSYTVQTDPIGWIVQRRYSDFLWLRELFCKIYPGINIPPLPKKTVLKNEKELYLQKRMKFLEKFLKSIFNCELLRHDKWFYAFLSSKEEKDLKQIQKLSTQVQKVTKLEQIISIDGKIQLEINDNLNTYNLEATQLVNSVDICYKKLRKDSKQLLLDFDQLSNTIFNMGSTCAELYQLSNKFNQSISQGKISQLDILYISMNNMLVQWGNNLTSQIQIVQEELCHFFKFHHHSVLVLKEFMKQKEHAQQEYEKFKSRLEYKKNKLFTSQDYSRWEISAVELKAFQDSNLTQNKEFSFQIMLPQETIIQEDLKNIFAYFNNQSYLEVTKLFENTVSEFSQHFTKFCSLQKEQIAEQKLIWDQSIVNLTNLQHPKQLIKKST